MAVVLPNLADEDQLRGFHLNSAPEGFERDLPQGFLEFYRPLHERLTPLQQALSRRREEVLSESNRGKLPDHREATPATQSDWKIEVPSWCRDQRNQMTGPADDGELCVKMLNSGAPGVMLDLEDSCVNDWAHQQLGIRNIMGCLRGDLTFQDKKRNREVSIKPSATVIWIRPRGLHMSQRIGQEVTSASLWDVARVVYEMDLATLKHPPAFYIPKTESAEEGAWWAGLFQELAEAKGWPRDTIKCMALIESHPMAYQMEEFLCTMREHIVGLNLGRWDYMASLIHFNLADRRWVLPDRNTIPHDVAFFQNLRVLLTEICHKRGALAIGGMTALYPSRDDKELNERALAVLEKDKKNEANCFFDGAWTGHPDQNQIAVDQFPFPNQMERRRGFKDEPGADAQAVDRYPDLRPPVEGVGKRTLAGTRAAVRTVIRYRNGVLSGRGASLLDGYMEDLATDRIYRLMIAQRVRHWRETPIVDENDKPVAHTPVLVTALFDEELEQLLKAESSMEMRERLRHARQISEAMVLSGEFNPI